MDCFAPSLYACVPQAGRGILSVSMRDGMHGCCRERDADKTAYGLTYERSR